MPVYLCIKSVIFYIEVSSLSFKFFESIVYVLFISECPQYITDKSYEWKKRLMHDLPHYN